MKQVDKTLDELGAVKNLTMQSLLAVLQALNEMTKSSQDFAGKDEREFFCAGMFDDQIADIRYFIGLRIEAARRQVEEDMLDPRFAHHGDQTFAGVEK